MASGHANRIKRPNTWLHRPICKTVKKALANPEPSTHGTFRTCRDVRVESVMRTEADISMLPTFSAWADEGTLIALREPRSVALPRWVVSLGPLAAVIAFHLGPQLVERPSTEAGYLLPDDLEGHPDRALAHPIQG